MAGNWGNGKDTALCPLCSTPTELGVLDNGGRLVPPFLPIIHGLNTTNLHQLPTNTNLYQPRDQPRPTCNPLHHDDDGQMAPL